jgi:type IV pilus assembly protein PilM
MALTNFGNELSLIGTLFSRQPEPLLGIDIGSSNIKLVELGQTKSGGWVLEKCAIEPLDHGWVVDGTIENFDEVLLAIKRLIKKTGTKTKSAVMALSPSAVITKKIMVSAGLSDQELEGQVEAEANQYIPFALEEASLDFCVVGPSANSPGDVEVLIAASRKEKVQDRLALAEAAGLKLAIIDVESYAARLALNRIIRGLPNEGLNATVALFEMGSQSTTMQVLRDGKLLYEREQPFGSGQLMKLIARQYGLTMEEAVIKRRNGELPSDYKTSVLIPFITGISNEIGRVLQFFFTSTQHNSVNYIMLSGEASIFIGLPRAVTDQTSFPCTVINPFEAMKVAEGVREKKLLNDAPAYLTACGLAMRRFQR